MTALRRPVRADDVGVEVLHNSIDVPASDMDDAIGDQRDDAAGADHTLYFAVEDVEVEPVSCLRHGDEVRGLRRLPRVFGRTHAILDTRMWLRVGDLRRTRVGGDDAREAFSQRHRELAGS